VNIPRPRSRASINHDPVFKQTRNEVIAYLLKSSERQKTEVRKKLVLPDLLPEDLDAPRRPFGARRPRRRSEQKFETVDVVQ
jgi:nitrate/nitrite transport system ATP-binding protein